MTIEKNQSIDRIEITESGHIQVRQKTVIIDDGVEIAQNYHRSVLEPGQDTSAFPDQIQKIANIVWTEKVISDYLNSQKEM